VAGFHSIMDLSDSSFPGPDPNLDIPAFFSYMQLKIQLQAITYIDRIANSNVVYSNGVSIPSVSFFLPFFPS
jgi:hypothetical protein